MIVLGVDPGETVGWCVYDDEAKRVVDSGQFAWDEFSAFKSDCADLVVIEKPVGQGPTRPTMVQCGICAGMLYESLRRDVAPPHWMTRLQIKQALTKATFGEIQVRNDPTAWAALLLIHGGDAAAKKGGPLHGVKGHARAALAAAVAYTLTT